VHSEHYVLNNWRRHRRHDHETGLYDDRLDPYSSAIHFPGWKERTQATLVPPRGYEPPRVATAQTFFATAGYRLARRPISCFETPGPIRR
jgi:hypothetical protein